MPAIKRFKALSIKRSPKPKAPIPAPADKNTEHNLAHYKSLPTVGPENVDALHLMAVGTSIWALAAVGLSVLLGATAARSAAWPLACVTAIFKPRKPRGPLAALTSHGLRRAPVYAGIFGPAPAFLGPLLVGRLHLYRTFIHDRCVGGPSCFSLGNVSL